jgi:hypothetical protein
VNPELQLAAEALRLAHSYGQDACYKGWPRQVPGGLDEDESYAWLCGWDSQHDILHPEA